MINEVVRISDDCYISYNPSTDANMAGLPETAIVLTDDGKRKFYIGHGDLRPNEPRTPDMYNAEGYFKFKECRRCGKELL